MFGHFMATRSRAFTNVIPVDSGDIMGDFRHWVPEAQIARGCQSATGSNYQRTSRDATGLAYDDSARTRWSARSVRV